MATVRYLVNDVDAALPFYRALGFRLTERWGPPFAILKRKGIELWLSGPGTSARKKLAGGAVPEPGGWNRRRDRGRLARHNHGQARGRGRAVPQPAGQGAGGQAGAG